MSAADAARRVGRTSHSRAAAMDAYLAPDVHMALHGDAAVFLHTGRDAYVIVDAADLRPSPEGGRKVRVEAHLERDLLAADLVQAQPSSAAFAIVRPAAPTHSLPDVPVTIHAADVLAFVVALARHLIDYRRSGLAQLISRAAKHRSAAGPTPIDRVATDAARLTSTFGALMIWSPWQGACLFRSLLLLRFLRLRGCDATWVLAIRTRPFLAHCWLQIGAAVLDDDAERLRAFTPLLAV